MKSLSIFVTFAAVLLCVGGTGTLFTAEAVEHHGFKVKDGGAGGGSYTECLQCHCVAISKDIPKCMPVCFLGKSHPLNAVYPPPQRAYEFRPVAEAQKLGIKFINGKTDCISCHNLMGDKSKHLRIQNGPDLCKACHVR